MTGNKRRKADRLVKVSKADRVWISPEVATLVLKRTSDGSTPITWEDVKVELAEMRGLGI